MWVEIGNQLRQAREAAGLSIEEVQDQTQIDGVSLRALENGDFNKISSPFYVRSYIRTVAKKLGLEPTYLLKHYRPLPEEGPEGGGSPSGGLENTGVFTPPPQATASFQPQKTLDSGRFQAAPASHSLRKDKPSVEEYDPFHNLKEEEPAEPAPLLPDDEELPSRSTPAKTKKWSVSELTQTLKMPALKKKGEEQGTGNGEENSYGTPGETSIPPRSRSNKRSVADRTPTGFHDEPVGEAARTAGASGTDRRDVSGGTRGFRSPRPEEPADPQQPAEAGLGDGRGAEELSRTAAHRLSRSGRQNAWTPAAGDGGTGEPFPPRGHGQPSPWFDGTTESAPSVPGDGGMSRSGRAGTSSNLPAISHPGQESGEMSRSGSRRQRALRSSRKALDAGKGAGKWVARKGSAVPKSPLARIAVAAVIILIPMTVWAASSLMEEPSGGGTGQATESAGPEAGVSSRAADGEGGGTARLLTVNQGPTISEYKLSEPDAVAFNFKAKETSWVQIRENQDGGYLKDVTLKPGEEFPFKHAKNVSTDLWVTIGSPDNVDLTINGQNVEANKTIHIIKNGQ